MATSPPDIIHTRSECGWSFKMIKDYIDYTGTYIPSEADKAGWLYQLLTAKPKILELAITNRNYTLTQVEANYILTVNLVSVFESILITLKPMSPPEGFEMRRLMSRVEYLEARLSDLEDHASRLTELETLMSGDSGERWR